MVALRPWQVEVSARPIEGIRFGEGIRFNESNAPSSTTVVRELNLSNDRTTNRQPPAIWIRISFGTGCPMMPHPGSKVAG